MRSIILILLCLQLTVAGQTKRTVKKPVPGESKDSIAEKSLISHDSLDPLDVKIRSERRFAVYNKRERGVDKRLKLCFQLTGDTVLNYCINDSTCRRPEVYKELFRQKDGDTTFVLLFVDAFTKETEKLCDGGKETKLIFVTWNTKRNRAKVKMRTIASCIKGITNMTKHDVAAWDGTEPLIVQYYRGNNKFIDMKFDPAEYRKGMQNVRLEDEQEDDD